MARFAQDHARGAQRVAAGLGWLSLGLGVLELIAPRRLAGTLGLSTRPGTVQGFGLRELVSGVALLSAGRKGPWLWARVAGDVLDLATLVRGVGRGNPQRRNLLRAIGAVAGVTALDVSCADALSRRRWR